MENIYQVLERNKAKAITLLKQHNGFIQFKKNGIMPEVIVNNHGDDCMSVEVAAVKLMPHDQIKILIDDWNDYISINDCLSTTADEVYKGIEKKVLKN